MPVVPSLQSYFELLFNRSCCFMSGLCPLSCPTFIKMHLFRPSLSFLHRYVRLFVVALRSPLCVSLVLGPVPGDRGDECARLPSFHFPTPWRKRRKFAMLAPMFLFFALLLFSTSLLYFFFVLLSSWTRRRLSRESGSRESVSRATRWPTSEASSVTVS